MNEILKFNKNYFTINDFNNLNMTFMNNSNFEKKELEETLEIYEDDNENKIYIIKNIENIKKIKHDDIVEIKTIEIIKKEEISSIYDYDFEIITYKEEFTNEKLVLKDDNIKTFLYYKDILYENKDLIIKARVIKSIKSEKNNLKESRVLKQKEEYHFEILKKTNIEVDNIIKDIIFGINGNIMSLKKEIQKEILTKYRDTTKKLFNINVLKNFEKDEIVLITPKPITLERLNIIQKEELGIISISNNYAVTEKADGERYLLYIDDTGKGYLINNTKEVRGTTLVNKNLKNSLYDGELILCTNRKDQIGKDIFAIFDVYIEDNNIVTKLPLIDDNKQSRYEIMTKKVKEMQSTTHDFVVKEQKTATKEHNIFEICNKILTEAESGTKYKYSIDGLIFTPTKLPVLGNYANIPIEFNKNMKWDKVFKWKPPEQNTIDFIIKDTNKIKSYMNVKKYREYELYVGYNIKQMETFEILKGLDIRYDDKKLKDFFEKENRYELKQLVIDNNLQYVHIEINEDGNCYTNETNELIENNSVIEFSYDNNIGNISNERKWQAQRVRIDKNRIYNFGKGSINKTANDWDVAMNIWRSIQYPISMNLIKGIEEIKFDIDLDIELTSQDKYYNRGSEKNNSRLISSKMNIFHNHIIKNMLYLYPPVINNGKRGNLLELACGQGSDINRWNTSQYTNVVGIDYVKDNIVNPINGIYNRYIEKYGNKYAKFSKLILPEMLFLIGDCGKRIKTGESAKNLDKDSEKIMKIVFNEKKGKINPEYNYPIITKKNFHTGFDVVSCMFSIHYFFTDEKNLDGFLQNIKDNLKVNGQFICTFMDGKTVETELNKNNNTIVGIDNKSKSTIWAIKKGLTTTSGYGKQISVYIENTGRFIMENLVDFELLQKKCLEYGLKLVKSEMFEKIYYEKLNEKDKHPGKKQFIDIKETLKDMDDNLKRFSFFNRWCIFEYTESM